MSIIVSSNSLSLLAKKLVIRFRIDRLKIKKKPKEIITIITITGNKLDFKLSITVFENNTEKTKKSIIISISKNRSVTIVPIKKLLLDLVLCVRYSALIISPIFSGSNWFSI